MTDVALLRQEYAAAAGCPEDELEPIPAMAPAYLQQALVPFQIAFPAGERSFRATFELRECAQVEGVLVRYGTLAPVYFPFLRAHWFEAGDALTVTLFCQ